MVLDVAWCPLVVAVASHCGGQYLWPGARWEGDMSTRKAALAEQEDNNSFKANPEQVSQPTATMHKATDARCSAADHVGVPGKAIRIVKP